MRKTPAERKALERQRKRARGLKKIELWTKPAQHSKIKEMVEQMTIYETPEDARVALNESGLEVHDPSYVAREMWYYDWTPEDAVSVAEEDIMMSDAVWGPLQ